MYFQDTVVLVFAKAPVAGQVNTRLIPDIGEQAATTLQHDLIHQRLSMLSKLNLCDVVLMCAPDTQHDVFLDCDKKYSVVLMQQTGDDLGARMLNGVEQALNNYKHCIVVGTDAPSLDETRLIEINAMLHEGNDVVLVPAEDGGYVSLALSQPYAFLFEGISWGSEVVLQQSKNKLDEMAVPYIELASCWDIDCLADYKRYLSALDELK